MIYSGCCSELADAIAEAQSVSDQAKHLIASLHGPAAPARTPELTHMSAAARNAKRAAGMTVVSNAPPDSDAMHVSPDANDGRSWVSIALGTVQQGSRDIKALIKQAQALPIVLSVRWSCLHDARGRS